MAAIGSGRFILRAVVACSPRLYRLRRGIAERVKAAHPFARRGDFVSEVGRKVIGTDRPPNSPWRRCRSVNMNRFRPRPVPDYLSDLAGLRSGIVTLPRRLHYLPTPPDYDLGRVS